MKIDKVIKLEKLLIELELYRKQNRQMGSCQIGRYIITPIYWGEEEDGEVVIDTESMLFEFEDLVKNYINTDFVGAD